MTPTAPEPNAPEAEGKNHRYVGNEIPWYVHALWVLFWVFLVSYVMVYLVPAIRTELLSPP
jgi:hypothetical protein